MYLTDELRSTKDNSPSLTWMFRGYDKEIEFNEKFKFEIRNFYKYGFIRSAKSVGLPEDIKIIAFVSLGGYVFFVKKNKSNYLFYYKLPDPLINKKIIRERFEKKYLSDTGNERYDDYFDDKYEQIKFNEDIIAISSINNYLFLLTVLKARTPKDDVWKLYRFDVNNDKGIIRGDDVVANLQLPQDMFIGYSEISMISVKYNNQKYGIFISSPNFENIICFDFKGEEKVFMDVLFKDDKYKSIRSSIHAYNISDSDNNVVRFFMISEKRLYIVICNELKKISSVRLIDVDNKDVVSAISVDISYEYLPFDIISPCLKSLNMKFIFILTTIESHLKINKKASKIYTYYEGVIMPMLGGGDISCENSLQRNLLNYDIGEIDIIMFFDKRFLLFGSKMNSEWYVMLHPIMYVWLEGLSSSYSNNENQNISIRNIENSNS